MLAAAAAAVQYHPLTGVGLLSRTQLQCRAGWACQELHLPAVGQQLTLHCPAATAATAAAVRAASDVQPGTQGRQGAPPASDSPPTAGSGAADRQARG
jgi:hypothetical protein